MTTAEKKKQAVIDHLASRIGELHELSAYLMVNARDLLPMFPNPFTQPRKECDAAIAKIRGEIKRRRRAKSA